MSRETKGTLYLIVGLLLLSYGDSALLYSRWNHVYNRKVIPVFHPWAIGLGLMFLVLFWRCRDKKLGSTSSASTPGVLKLGRSRKIKR